MMRTLVSDLPCLLAVIRAHRVGAESVKTVDQCGVRISGHFVDASGYNSALCVKTQSSEPDIRPRRYDDLGAQACLFVKVVGQLWLDRKVDNFAFGLLWWLFRLGDKLNTGRCDHMHKRVFTKVFN